MEQNNNLPLIRHSLAHLLASSVLELFPSAKPTLGPATDTGFYYDFDFGTTKLTESDLALIEAKMKEILPTWHSFERKEVTEEEARKHFNNNEYKQELIQGIVDANEPITLYTSGTFTDLCRGGHVEDASNDIPVDGFMLDTIAGAYWRGDETKPMLTRIYGLAFGSKESLDNYLSQREEAKKRDHKKIGKEMNLFAFSELVGKGLPLLLPKGQIIREELEKYITQKKKDLGYVFVTIPHIAKRALYEKSGHMGKYDAMMPVMIDNEGDEYVMKAMNCPHHFEIYNAEQHSYRDLPLRIAENTTVYRNEKSGELSGLTRVKNLTQDDTHHFIRRSQISSEIKMIITLMESIFNTFDFKNYRVQISVRDESHKESYFGDDALWQESQDTLVASVTEWGVPFSIEQGEAAFYGPKIDVMVKDSIGREWQLTTVQLDFNQPINFDMTYTNEEGKKEHVVVLHAAIYGSIERFMGILIEHYSGNFPLWLAPTQVAILPVAGMHDDIAHDLASELRNHDLRITVLESGDSIGKRLREVKSQKVPYYVVIGDKEVSSADGLFEKIVTIEHCSGEKKEMTIAQLRDSLINERDEKRA